MALSLQTPACIQLRSFSKFDVYGNSPIPANKQRFVPTSGTYPKGFVVGSSNVGIKPSSKSQPDLILVASEAPSCGAAVFTKNQLPAASITVSRDLLRKTQGQGLQAIIANSWCANTLTGQTGLDDALAMSRETDKYVRGEQSASHHPSTMVMHTGTGGKRLPINAILTGLPRLYHTAGATHAHWLTAAHGLRTTDTFPKLASLTFTLPSHPTSSFSLAGLTKGAGMIHPNMATTLGILCTDAPVTAPALQAALTTAVSKSYNCISVDGDTSTNDMVAALANGGAAAPGTPPVTYDPASPDFAALQRAFTALATDLAQLVVRDAEGASKFLTIRVRHAPSDAAARLVAAAIARSVLVKTAAGGDDADGLWGTVLAAVGYALVDSPYAGTVVPERTSISMVPADGGPALKFLETGVPMEVDGGRAREVMGMEEVEVVVELGGEGGGEEAVYWTCDLTHDFITMNGGFSTGVGAGESE